MPPQLKNSMTTVLENQLQKHAGWGQPTQQKQKPDLEAGTNHQGWHKDRPIPQGWHMHWPKGFQNWQRPQVHKHPPWRQTPADNLNQSKSAKLGKSDSIWKKLKQRQEHLRDTQRPKSPTKNLRSRLESKDTQKELETQKTRTLAKLNTLWEKANLANRQWR